METTKRCTFCQSEIDSKALKCPSCRSRQLDAPPLHRGAPGAIIGGVCAGIARYLGVDVALVRVGFAFATLFSLGLALTAYLMLWAITPPTAVGATPLSRFFRSVKDLFTPSQRQPAASPPAP